MCCYYEHVSVLHRKREYIGTGRHYGGGEGGVSGGKEVGSRRSTSHCAGVKE